MKIILTILAILYALWPIDFIPDWLIGLGWMDDLALLSALWYFFFYKKGPYYRQSGDQRARSGSNDYRQNSQGRFQGEKENSDQTADRNNPYKVLEIEPTDDKEQIKQAYRNLANRYHPDKVAHLGKEFQKLAEKRFKEIQKAYQQLMGN